MPPAPAPASPADGVTRDVEPGKEAVQVVVGESVKVTIPPDALDAPATLTIRRVAGAPDAAWAAMRRGEAWDVSVGERKPFSRPISIDLALDRSLLPDGEEPARSAVAAYYDEGSKRWVTVPSAVDAARGRVG